MFYEMARESGGLGRMWFSYYLNAYEAAGESGIRALTYRKKIPEKIFEKARHEVTTYLRDFFIRHFM